MILVGGWQALIKGTRVVAATAAPRKGIAGCSDLGRLGHVKFDTTACMGR